MTTQDNLLFLIETGKPLEIKQAIAVRMSIQGYRRAEIAETLGVSISFIDKLKHVWGRIGERLNIPMTNFRKCQTWYDAVNCYTWQFFS